MKLHHNIYLIIFMLTVIIVSCAEDDPEMPDQQPYIKFGEKVSAGANFDMQFLSDDSLFVGYNKVYFKVTEKSSGQTLNQASIELHPLMDMGTFKHACPYENPGVSAGSDGYFSGAILFSMPGSDNSWSLSASITANGKTDSIYFPISKVIATNPAKKIVVIDSLPNGPGSWIITKYPVSLVEPASWKVGNNPYEITVHKMASMMSFPAVNDLTIEITPEMPSMGHGSPNNINPVYIGNGHYKGTVNFTMTGAWRINMVFRKEGRMIGKNVWFDIDF